MNPDDPMDSIAPDDLRDVIRRNLTGRQADVMLRVLEGHGTRRIARDMALAKATVAEHIQAAKRRIRRELEAGQEDAA